MAHHKHNKYQQGIAYINKIMKDKQDK